MLILRRCGSCAGPGPSPCPTCANRVGDGPVPVAVTGYRSVTAALVYDDIVRDLVLALKYRRDRSALGWLVGRLAAVLPELGCDTVITWVPTTAARRRRRGVDQAELIARRLAAETGRPARSLLRRTGAAAQTGRSAQDRAVGPDLVSRRRWVASAPSARPQVASVLVVDDVLTTGATLRSAAAALAGKSVDLCAAVVAVAPGPSAPQVGTTGRSREPPRR